MVAWPVDLVPLRFIHTDAYRDISSWLIARIDRKHGAAAIALWFYLRDGDPDPKAVPPSWRINWVSRPDWQRGWLNPSEEAPDCDVAAFERPGRPVFIQRADLERLATEGREVYVICVHLKWFKSRNMRDGELEQEPLRAWGEDAPPQSAGSEEASNVQPEAPQERQQPQPLKGEALDEALNKFAERFKELPGRDELYGLTKAKENPELWNATHAQLRRLRQDYASAESKKGGARCHKSRRGAKLEK